MVRHTDWMARLMRAVETARVLPFAYGLHDCCTFAAYCVDAMCEGSRIGELMRQRHPYKDEEDAYEYIETQGGLTGLVSQYLGAPMENTLFATVGDVCVVHDDVKEVVGVIIGHNIVAPGSRGLRSMPLRDLIAAWSV